MKIHSRNLHAPLCAIFAPNSVNVARYASLIWQSIYALNLPQIGSHILQKAIFKHALSNLIHNSIVHNPNGCKVSLTLGINDEACSFSISDNGKGISKPLLDLLNHDEDISSTQEQSDRIDHGLGLKVVRQIVKAHQGKIRYFDAAPDGLSIRIELSLR